MTPEELVEVRGRVFLAEEMTEPHTIGVLEWYRKDVPKLLELVDKQQVYLETRLRELRFVDDVLQWSGTGEGRVSSIKRLQERVRELEAEIGRCPSWGSHHD